MKINMNKMVLDAEIKKVSKAISNKNVIPVLGGIHVKASHEGLTLTGSDSDLSIKTFISSEGSEDAEVISEGSVVLPAKEFSKIVHSMPEQEVIVELFGE